MSFILEALKKSDKKHQENAAPELGTVHRSVWQKKDRRPFWFGLLGGLLLLASVAFWFFPAKTPIKELSETPLVVNHDSRKQTPAVAVRTTPQQVSPPEPKSSDEKKSPSIGVKESIALNPQRQRVFALADLPITLQNRLPQLHMSLHAFSPGNPKASLVRINGQILREGDRLAGKYRLDKIVKKGAILVYDNYRFLVPRKGISGP
ncbi:MAG: general secretion pathway protein GspB [Deltaproteobacteria bacterium]|nr:general secretion pathway protein GspB [Deltaproteobacteria bacterium]